MKKDSIYNYSSCIKILIGEIRQYNQSKEIKSKKKKKIQQISQMNIFIDYMNSLNGTFIQSKMKLLWQKNKLTKYFLQSLVDYSYDEIIPLLIEILCGNFSKAEKKFIIDKNKKPVIFFLLPFNKIKNILFCICIRTDISNKLFGNEYIYFLSICQENEYKNHIEAFINKISLEKNNKKFPEVPFDKIGLYSNKICFLKRLKKIKNQI